MESIIDTSNLRKFNRAAKDIEHNKTKEKNQKLREVLEKSQELKERFENLSTFSRKIRISEYQITNSCNIRCQGCWFFAYDHDKETKDEKQSEALAQFLQKERTKSKVNAALLIGGEPALFPDRIQLFRREMQYLSVSTNGLKRIPYSGLEDTAIAVSLFGGGPLDDRLRGITPSGRRLDGLFETALANYRQDPRVTFIYAITEDGIEHIEETVSKIEKNGNLVNFNYYTPHNTTSAEKNSSKTENLVETAIRIKKLYPRTVVSHDYFIRTMITGKSHWDTFTYNNCPSISVDHPAHSTRKKNGNPYLPRFNTWAADLKTIKFCCTSGHCTDCRDSQAVFSWLLVSMKHFLSDANQFRTWIELTETYWRQFIWSPYHPTKKASII